MLIWDDKSDNDDNDIIPMITKYKVNKVCVFKWKGRGWKGEGDGNKGGKFIEYVYARFCLIEILTSESLKVVDSYIYVKKQKI